METLFGSEIQRDACISECGRYRWSLSRSWDADLRKPWLGWIMLNPSTADASIDDATIRRCVNFARSWGFAGIAVRNLFALRATDPRELYKSEDPVGLENDKAILDLVGVCPVIVAAWGVHGSLRDRDKTVIRMLQKAGVELACLGCTKDNHPLHPLRLAGDTKLGRWLTEVE